jgi:hypothetical protein
MYYFSAPLSIQYQGIRTKTGWLGFIILWPSGLLFQWASTINIQLSMLVYVKEDIFIISSNATCSRHNIAEILFNWRQAIITKSLSLQPTRCYNVMGKRVVVFNAIFVYSGVRFFGIFFFCLYLNTVTVTAGTFEP